MPTFLEIFRPFLFKKTLYPGPHLALINSALNINQCSQELQWLVKVRVLSQNECLLKNILVVSVLYVKIQGWSTPFPLCRRHGFNIHIFYCVQDCHYWFYFYFLIACSSLSSSFSLKQQLPPESSSSKSSSSKSCSSSKSSSSLNLLQNYLLLLNCLLLHRLLQISLLYLLIRLLLLLL